MDSIGCMSFYLYTVSYETAAKTPESPGFSARIVPNPAAAESALWLDVQQSQRLEIQILDAYGRVLWSATDLFTAGARHGKNAGGIGGGFVLGWGAGWFG